MLPSVGLGEGSARGEAIYGAQGPCKETAPQSKGNFSLSAEHSTRYQLWLWELAFRRHSPLRGQLGGTGAGRREEGEGALIPGPGNRFLLGHLGFGMWFEKGRRPPRATLGDSSG